jgi:23S rRNA (cytidine1920-2'-O)/16S rRNA (cytidine1409-2'-O)-methyltransferase
VKKERIDVLLVERGLAESRAKAQALVLAGEVVADDQRVDKPGTRINVEAELRLKGEGLKFVSRGGLKLEAALDAFKLDVRDALCADIGASTGGFTDCLLQRGAKKVWAIDVGKAQLHEKLRQDPRVVSMEGVNARALSAAELPEPVQVAVVDVSFISLALVLPPLVQRMAKGALLVALVKPQFEVGPEKVEKGGVVKDPAARAESIQRNRKLAVELGLTVLGVIDSPIAGPAGNVEALLVARR